MARHTRRVQHVVYRLRTLPGEHHRKRSHFETRPGNSLHFWQIVSTGCTKKRKPTGADTPAKPDGHSSSTPGPIDEPSPSARGELADNSSSRIVEHSTIARRTLNDHSSLYKDKGREGGEDQVGKEGKGEERALSFPEQKDRQGAFWFFTALGPFLERTENPDR